ncbi:FimV/HubP-related protein [Massilia haematophila]|uniref:FimV N-terminal domain-containing protein n=3 Tax=Massilia TaxID=149698 RepID=A0ABV7PC45_9BURK
MAIRPFYIVPAVLLAYAALGPVHAAELGEARVRSHIGQALAADVELTLVEDPSRPVAARLAHPDVYRGANIALPALLSSLDIAVIRQGGKQFLHLTSSKPVESRHLHVYLELVDGGQRNVRLVTLWFTPDPHPAPAPAAAPVPTPALAPAPAPAPLPAPVVTAAPVAAPAKASTDAAPAKAVRKPAPPKRRAAPAQAQDVQAPSAVAAPKDATPAPKRPAAIPAGHAAEHAAGHAAGSDAPAACAPQPAEVQAQAQACAVLGAKNEALRQELGQLEEKVKVLQVATGVKSAAEAAAQDAPKPDAQAKPAPRIQRKPKPAPPPNEPTPWLAIAAGIAAVLALLGVAVLLRRRRAQAGQVLRTAREPEVVVLPQDGTAETKPSLMAAVKARLMAVRRNRPAPQAPAEAPENVDEKIIVRPE